MNVSFPWVTYPPIYSQVKQILWITSRYYPIYGMIIDTHLFLFSQNEGQKIFKCYIIPVNLSVSYVLQESFCFYILIYSSLS